MILIATNEKTFDEVGLDALKKYVVDKEELNLE
jgi:hypothetical protein